MIENFKGKPGEFLLWQHLLQKTLKLWKKFMNLFNSGRIYHQNSERKRSNGKSL
jgi:hypothetical protein